MQKYVNRFDVIICHDFTRGLTSLGIKRNIPLVYYAHDVAVSVFKMFPFIPLRQKLRYILFMKYLAFAEKRTCKEADLIVAIARCVKEDLCKYYNVSPKKSLSITTRLPSSFDDAKTFMVGSADFLHIAMNHEHKG